MSSESNSTDPTPMDQDGASIPSQSRATTSNRKEREGTSPETSDTERSTSSKAKDTSHAHSRKSHKDKKLQHGHQEGKQQDKDPKKDAQEIVDHYQAKLDKLVSQYNMALKRDASPETLKKLHTDITYTRKTLEQFKETCDKTYGSSTSNGNTIASSNTLESKTTDRMTAKDVPRFQLTTSSFKDPKHTVFESVEHFLSHFKKIVEVNTNSPISQQWAKWLPIAFPYHLDYWYESKLEGRNYSWHKVCKVVRKRFKATDTELAKATEVYTMTMKSGESISDYGDRFHNAAREGNLQNDQGLAMRFLASLPDHIQDNVRIVWHSRHKKRKPDNLDEILSVADQISVKKRYRPADEQSERSSRRGKSSSSKDTYWCPYHKRQVEHKPEDCKKKKAQSKAQDSTTDPFKLGKCVHCGDDWTKEHRCEEYREAHRKKREQRAHNKRINALSTSSPSITSPQESSSDHPADEALLDFDEDMADFDQLATGKQLGNTQKQSKSETLIRSPILIQNKRCLALMDSGAEISVLNKRLCDENNWSINHVDGNIWYAGSGDARPRIGTTSPLQISYNGHKPLFSFEVMNLAHDDVIIGKDLMPLIGVALTGLAFKWDDDDSTSDSPSTLDMVEQKHNEPNNSPAGTPNERHDFERQIKPFMEANARIPKASYCNLEESVIELPTPGVHSSYHRQYPIPFSLRPAVDAAVKKWLEDGVIIRAPVNNAWNSPLTLAPKKDAQGNKTGMRPCLDPRHINRYLPDDKYPLPLIRDIFEALSGSKVFTTLDLTNAFHRFKIKAEDQHKTTFTHNGRQYMFQGCPFGLKPISSKFQRVMHRIFGNMPFVQTFVDDIVIHSPDMHTHTQHVKQAIQALTDANLILNPAKCHMAQTHIYLLGFAISHKGISLDKRKLTNVLEWPIPKTGKDIQRFLGIVTYFQEHIPNVAAIRAPLDQLRNLDSLQDIWNDEHLQCFHKLKRALEADVLLE
ncbi:hypothetical protein O0I10_013136 [Lichtheimia ornata]|uniref:Reverse transcriptase domain-containing protein n=1 Tax=Lichtheimia ornata TaxID=688661 RepID=A0AAD7USB5_9FUNG|nr:uncharacterized protein O0I10_013136 [Lichtheimia ornata]KAJ8651356.1 hypothetical protein O0I10_013136 [Lichtheimia ornata]